MKSTIRSILVSTPPPTVENSPYSLLAREWELEVDYCSFVQIEGISTSEFRKQNINPMDFSAILFTNKSAVDHFFRICKDLRIEMPVDTKYFCVTDATAKYLQKYIVIRKRKLYVGEKTMQDLIDITRKHDKERYLFPTGDVNRTELNELTAQNKLNLTIGIVYQTTYADLQQTLAKDYDMICLFSPTSVESLFNTAPNYQQGTTIIAVFGNQTAKAAEEKGLRLDIVAPQPEFPSMTMAIDHYLRLHRQ